RHWGALTADPPAAWEAIRTLSARPAQAVPWLSRRLSPAAAPDPTAVKRLLAGLDAERFEDRERATKELAKLGEGAAPALREAAEGAASPEVRRRARELLDKAGESSGEQLRLVRAVEVLERCGTAEAKSLLERLAGGAGARLTREAKAALARQSMTLR